MTQSLAWLQLTGYPPGPVLYSRSRLRRATCQPRQSRATNKGDSPNRPQRPGGQSERAKSFLRNMPPAVYHGYTHVAGRAACSVLLSIRLQPGPLISVRYCVILPITNGEHKHRGRYLNSPAGNSHNPSHVQPILMLCPIIGQRHHSPYQRYQTQAIITHREGLRIRSIRMPTNRKSMIQSPDIHIVIVPYSNVPQAKAFQ